MRLRYFHEADPHEVEAVRSFALAANHLPGSKAQEIHFFAQASDELVCQFGEHRNRAQMGIQSAPAVGLIQLRAKRFVALHDVQHVAQHLQRGAVGFGSDCGRARVQAHTGHFTEEVARSERGDGIVVIQIHGRVNVNPVLAGFFFALVVLALGESAGKLSQKLADGAFGFYVRHRTGDGNFRLAF